MNLVKLMLLFCIVLTSVTSTLYGDEDDDDDIVEDGYYKTYTTDFYGNINWLFKLDDRKGYKFYWEVENIDPKDPEWEKEIREEWGYNIYYGSFTFATYKNAYGRVLKEYLLKNDHLITGKVYNLQGEIRDFIVSTNYLKYSPIESQPIDEIMEESEKKLDDFEQEVEEELGIEFEEEEEQQHYKNEVIYYCYPPPQTSRDVLDRIKITYKLDDLFKRVEIIYDSEGRKFSEVIYDKNDDEKIFYIYKYFDKYTVLRVGLVHIKNFVRGKRYPFGREGTPKFKEVREFKYNKNMQLKQETFYNLRKQKLLKYSYDYNEDGDLTDWRIDDYLHNSKRKIKYKYDDYGNVTSKKYFSRGNVLTKKDTYKYDKKGNVIREKHYIPGNNLVEWTKYTFDKNGYPKKKLYYKGKKQIVKKAKARAFDDPFGMQILEHEYDNNNRFLAIHQYRYNTNGKIFEDAIFNEKRRFKGMIKYFYDENDQLIESLHFDANGYLYYLSRRYYDEKGRNISMVEQYFRSPKGMLIKTLGFYLNEFGNKISHYFEDNFKNRVNYTNENMGIKYIYYVDGKLDQVQIFNERDILVRIKEKRYDYSMKVKPKELAF